MFRYADELLQNLGMSIDSHTMVKNLSTAERHLVEIAMALSQEAKILIMDEPTSCYLQSVRQKNYLIWLKN
jgi:ABC-type sugar transport system ATPase subunit